VAVAAADQVHDGPLQVADRIASLAPGLEQPYERLLRDVLRIVGAQQGREAHHPGGMPVEQLPELAAHGVRPRLRDQLHAL
jgi:hypothetical protein